MQFISFNKAVVISMSWKGKIIFPKIFPQISLSLWGPNCVKNLESKTNLRIRFCVWGCSNTFQKRSTTIQGIQEIQEPVTVMRFETRSFSSQNKKKWPTEKLEIINTSQYPKTGKVCRQTLAMLHAECLV